MKIETIAVHAGNKIDPSTKAVVQPITLATTFERDEDGGYSSGFQYSRANNPNRQALEECLAQLEGGEAAACFASGSAAAMTVFQALNPGDHIIAPDDMYHGVQYLLKGLMHNWNLETSFVNMADLSEIKKNIKKNTRLIWIETPSNPLLRLYDIKEISSLAKEAGAITVTDNTFCTPILQRPLEIGSDLVMHATTKYLGGHSDVLGGAIVSRKNDEFFQKVKDIQRAGGAVAAPFDCFLTLRGIRTLPYRMKAHSENAKQLADYLSKHSGVEKVFYPGLSEELPAQMKTGGGMLSFLVKGDEAKARKVANSTEICTQATSLGGVESLIEHRASIEGPDTKTPRNLIRLSVGLENVEDLKEDLDKAIK